MNFDQAFPHAGFSFEFRLLKWNQAGLGRSGFGDDDFLSGCRLFDELRQMRFGRVDIDRFHDLAKLSLADGAQ